MTKSPTVEVRPSASANFAALLLVVVAALSWTPHFAAAAAGGGLHASPHGNALPSHREAFGAIAKSISDKIKHIIILMEENRSFDHMFGYYGKGGTNGLTGKEYNLLNVSDPNSQRIYVDNKAPYINKCDPAHNLNPTTAKIFGSLEAGAACNYTCEAMSGFVQYEYTARGPDVAIPDDYCSVMQSLDNAEKLPVLTALADEYVLMDRFFCSVPGPTWPNRLFHLAASSGGDTSTGPFYHNMPGKLYPMKTIFDQVHDVGGEWKLYYNDTPWEMILSSLAHNPEHMHSMDTFFTDCETGNLPDYAFINPRAGINVTTGIGANDQHPDHDIRAGEQFYKDVYEALRASPQWNETLFIITYDEHGGFYDHVTPPTRNVPIPDDEKSYPGDFLFNRLGMRIPTLLISPWVPKGLVVGRAPEAQRPHPDSEYDLTSIMASARKILKKLEGVPALTKRDAWASTFEHVLDILPEARTDCPMHLPMPEPPTPAQLAEEAQQPINDLQADIMHVHHVLASPHEDHNRHHHRNDRSDGEALRYPPHLQQQAHIGDFVTEAFAHHKKRTAAWKASKRRPSQSHSSAPAAAALPVEGSPIPNAVVLYGPGAPPNLLAMTWMVRKSTAASVSSSSPPSSAAAVYHTISTNLSTMPSIGEVCLDAPSLEVGAAVAVSICYPSANPDTNRDLAQQWIYGADTTIRPRKNTSLCLDTDSYADPSSDSPYGRAFLSTCDGDNVKQRHAYDGDAPGNDNPQYCLWSGASYLQVMTAYPSD